MECVLKKKESVLQLRDRLVPAQGAPGAALVPAGRFPQRCLRPLPNLVQMHGTQNKFTVYMAGISKG